MSQQLVILYQEMAQLTSLPCNNGKLECGKFATNPYRCCTAEYCEQTRQFAKDKYNIDLVPGDGPIPFLSRRGCIVPPHLRPICTLHVCQVSWGDCTLQKDDNFLKKYWSLRKLVVETSRQEDKLPPGIQL